MLLRKILLIALVLTIASSGSGSAMVIRDDVPDSKYLADPANYPGVFILLMAPGGAPDCAATVIDKQFAITAAHCTQDPRFMNPLTMGGGVPVTIAGKTYVIEAAFRHPSFDLEGWNQNTYDLALLRFKTPVDVAPYPLSDATDEVGYKVIMPGWGATGTGKTGVIRDDLKFRVAENYIDGALEHVLMWDFDDPAKPTGVVADIEGISGAGDSGGPAFLETEKGLAVAGISSGQITNSQRPGTYGVVEVYARVSTALPWIRETIEAQRK